jgi:hypothetical protein
MKTKKGSILAVSLIILSAMLVTALSMSLVSVKNRKNTISSGKSNRAFQTADAGIELVMADIEKGDHVNGKVNEIVGNITGANCNDGIINGIDFSIELFGEDGEAIDCNSGDVDISDIARIKSVGRGESETRAIEAAVAAGGCFTMCDHDSDENPCEEAQKNDGTGTDEYRVINCTSSGGDAVTVRNLQYSDLLRQWRYINESGDVDSCEGGSILVAKLDC